MTEIAEKDGSSADDIKMKVSDEKQEVESEVEKTPPEETNGHGETADDKDKVNVCDEKQASERNESNMEADVEANSSHGQATSPVPKEDEKANEKKKEDDQTEKKESLGSTVAKHYNNIPAGSKEVRKTSRIFFLRNFNNWCKSVLISEFLEKVKRHKRLSDEVNVLDLGCGKGGDLLKWEKGRVDHVILADIAETSIEHCKERYKKLEKEQRGRKHSSLFTTEYHAVDCTKVRLSEKYKKKDMKIDLTSCQFAFHYSFESYEQADMMLKNACENLRVGGYFIGTTLNANKVVSRLKKAEGDQFGNSVYNIQRENKTEFPLFGAQYMFHLEDVVDCPEFLVHIPTLEKLAAKYNMVLKWKKSFHQLFEDYKRDFDSLLSRMNALEKYPSGKDKPLCGPDDQYDVAKEYMKKRSTMKTVGTLSADEWEMAGLYLAFAFEKVEPPRESRASERDDRKRRRDRSGDNRSRSQDNRHKDSRKRGNESTSAKRSRKESETEEMYEIKDEVEGDDEEGGDEEKETAESSDAPPNEPKEDTKPSEAEDTPAATTTTTEETAAESDETDIPKDEPNDTETPSVDAPENAESTETPTE